jgi:hypothetical protein
VRGDESAAEVTAVEWRGLSEGAAGGIARAVARRMGVEFVRVFGHEYCGRRSPVAEFDVGGRTFCLVPGGPVRLGFDERAWWPTEEEMASFLGDPDALEPFSQRDRPAHTPQWTGEELGAVRAHLAACTTRPREVDVPCLLVAAEAEEAGVTEVGVDHPRIREILAQGPPCEGLTTFMEGWNAPDDDTRTFRRIRFDPAGRPVQAWLVAHTTYRDVVGSLAAAGQRLLDPDEWEHAVGFGARTLFPWGDRCPDRYTAAGFGTPDGVSTPLGVPLLSGLRFTGSGVELTGAVAEVRAGDGGEAEHDAAPEFHAWLTRAPSFRSVELGLHTATRVSVRRTWVRPAVPIT